MEEKIKQSEKNIYGITFWDSNQFYYCFFPYPEKNLFYSEELFSNQENNIVYLKGLLRNGTYIMPFGSFLAGFANIDIEFFEHELNGLFNKTFARFEDGLKKDYKIDFFVTNLFATLLKYHELPVAQIICMTLLLKVNKYEFSVYEANLYFDEFMKGFIKTTYEAFEEIKRYKKMALDIISDKTQSTTMSIIDNLVYYMQVVPKYTPESKELVFTYSTQDIPSCLVFDTVQCLKNDIMLKKCANCGKYFVPTSRSDEIYCDNLNENGKTCKQVGYENKLKKDVFKTAYRRAYKTQRARIKYNSHIQNYEKLHFKPWEVAAKKALEEYTANNDIDGFEKWLKDNRDSF